MQPGRAGCGAAGLLCASSRHRSVSRAGVARRARRETARRARRCRLRSPRPRPHARHRQLGPQPAPTLRLSSKRAEARTACAIEAAAAGRRPMLAQTDAASRRRWCAGKCARLCAALLQSFLLQCAQILQFRIVNTMAGQLQCAPFAFVPHCCSMFVATVARSKRIFATKRAFAANRILLPAARYLVARDRLELQSCWRYN